MESRRHGALWNEKAQLPRIPPGREVAGGVRVADKDVPAVFI